MMLPAPLVSFSRARARARAGKAIERTGNSQRQIQLWAMRGEPVPCCCDLSVYSLLTYSPSGGGSRAQSGPEMDGQPTVACGVRRWTTDGPTGRYLGHPYRQWPRSQPYGSVIWRFLLSSRSIVALESGGGPLPANVEKQLTGPVFPGRGS